MTTDQAHVATVLALRLGPDDHVAVVVENVGAGSWVRVGTGAVTALGDVPRGHKIALNPVAPGDPIRKYGQIIGFATSRIGVGEHIHTHDLEFGAFTREYQIGTGVGQPSS